MFMVRNVITNNSSVDNKAAENVANCQNLEFNSIYFLFGNSPHNWAESIDFVLLKNKKI